MTSVNSLDKKDIKDLPLLKPGNGIQPGDNIVVKAEYNGEVIKHRHRLAAWKLMGIDVGEIDFNEQSERGLIVNVQLYTISPQNTASYLFVDEVIGQFDSSIVDKMIDSISQDIEEAREQLPDKAFKGWTDNINITRRKM